MATKRKRIPRYGTAEINGHTYYRTVVTDSEGNRRDTAPRAGNPCARFRPQTSPPHRNPSSRCACRGMYISQRASRAFPPAF